MMQEYPGELNIFLGFKIIASQKYIIVYEKNSFPHFLLLWILIILMRLSGNVAICKNHIDKYFL